MSRVVVCLVAVLWVSWPCRAQDQGLSIPGSASRPGVVATSPRDPASTTGTARIRGRVLAADTGQPIRRAQVRLTSAALRESRTTATDLSGRFDIKELPPGRYTVSAQKGSFVTMSYGQTRPFESGKPLQVADGETVESVDIRLPRGGIVTGTVFDEFGEPVTDAMVTLMRLQFVQGRRGLTPVGRTASTNDIGEYRVFGLPAGQYFLSATLRGPMNMGESADRSGYAPTYYPGTSNVAEAELVSVGAGTTLSGLNMALSPTKTARVAGSAVDSEGKPLSNGFVNVIQRSGGMMSMVNGGPLRPDGTFAISNVPPGEYTLQVMYPGSFGQAPEVIVASITVAGADIDGVRLMGIKPSAITGRVVAEPVVGFQPTSLVRVLVVPLEPSGGMYGGDPAVIRDDSTFELKARPGKNIFRITGPLSDWSLKAVRLNGLDVTDSGIDVRPNEDVSGVEIELTNRRTQVTGQVTDGRGQMSKDYSVVLFARNPERWGWMSRHVALARPDQNARFQVRTLPPGQYYAAVFDSLEPDEIHDPEFLDRARLGATEFTLGEGETKALELEMSAPR